MYVSVKGEYALHAILDLAMHNSGQPVRIADIARRQKIPQKFLELILSNLKQGGFVESRRGAEGGYLLARPPDTITVAEVMRYVEGTPKQRSKRQPETPFAEMWLKVENAVAEILENSTFGEIARMWAERQTKYVPNWDI